jgi:mono/diheme cytochrome c family protein
MKMRMTTITVLFIFAALAGCRKPSQPKEANPLEDAYGSEADWNNPQRIIPLDYQQTQGQRVFYAYCVWCHADSTPAGPSNRANLTPSPALANDGEKLNAMSDESLQNIIALGGAAMSKSAMMPPWGGTLKTEDIHGVIAFMRAIAQPRYNPAARSTPQDSEKSGK